MATQQIIPYISFNGTCEEALAFYKDVFGGKVEIVTRYDNPAMNAPEAYRNKILHARFYADGITIFASDVMPGKTAKGTSGDVALSIAYETAEEGKQVFDGLSAGGDVHIPFKKQFWGDYHGNFTDKYGIRWMVNTGNDGK
ncbi:VOC family protein [Chitinophaga horti]|uniref:VOC family protein n=1 Tax=Chitinophaga horti TaxID=2920382 RepID=A0ABY6J165_9BACT|nr:VOC family protein [Chitinophaga horti]UYQ93396.1 VOC family protein [Chitinophaga horti]